MNTILSRFYKPEILNNEEYRLDENDNFTIPVANEYEEFVRHIRDFPTDIKPSIFGLHENANMIRDQQETSNLLNNILTTQVRFLRCCVIIEEKYNFIL